MKRILASGLIVAMATIGRGPAIRAAGPPADEEQQIGQEVLHRAEGAHFRQNPATFGSFSSDLARATAFSAPKAAPEVFLR